MLSSKSKGLFVEISGFSILAAVTSGFEPPLTIESLHECQASDDVDEIRRFIDGLRTKKSRAFLPAHCAIYPQSRFVRKTTLDSPAKAKDPNYFAELLSSQFRIDPETNSVAVVNAVDGSEFDVEKGLQNQKELLFCGAGANEITEIQDQLIEYGIYPDTLELGSVSSIGGLKNYSRFKKERFPTLILEITPENSNVFIFGNEQVDICRPIPYGLNSMFPTVQSELGLKDEDSSAEAFLFQYLRLYRIGTEPAQENAQGAAGLDWVLRSPNGTDDRADFLTLLPVNFRWIHSTLAKSLGVDVLNVDYAGWLNALEISVGDRVQLESVDNRWVGLFGLMGDYSQEGSNGVNQT